MMFTELLMLVLEREYLQKSMQRMEICTIILDFSPEESMIRRLGSITSEPDTMMRMWEGLYRETLSDKRIISIFILTFRVIR